MKLSTLIVASTALLATACGGTEGNTAGGTGPEVTAEPVVAPNNGDWSTIIRKTSDGGFIMGNPDAKVKLVEFASMTCPHCATFEEEGAKPLVDNYVKKGLVSWELRNFVRDPFDMTATLLARCGGEANYFGMTRSLFAEQRNWMGELQKASEAQLGALQSMPPAQQFSTIADLANLKQFAAMRGVPRAKADQCLSNEAEINTLVQMNSDAASNHNIPGTPSFLINGKLVESTAAWAQLEPKIKEALAD
ncbi:thioredoxin domain-containing protein [Sphingomonas xanthus]|nr:thioredoxin domain-containing protein [Sphingomonas xanthus]